MRICVRERDTQIGFIHERGNPNVNIYVFVIIIKSCTDSLDTVSLSVPIDHRT